LQIGKFQKDMDVQSKEIKEVSVVNRALKEQLANLLKDTDLRITEVSKSCVIRILRGVSFISNS
jgi:hypothetical protein